MKKYCQTAFSAVGAAHLRRVFTALHILMSFGDFCTAHYFLAFWFNILEGTTKVNVVRNCFKYCSKSHFTHLYITEVITHEGGQAHKQTVLRFRGNMPEITKVNEK